MIYNNRTFVLSLKMQSKLRGAGHCTSAGRMTSVLWHIAEAFPPARQTDNPKQPSSHRHCYQYLNDAKLHLSAA